MTKSPISVDRAGTKTAPEVAETIRSPGVPESFAVFERKILPHLQLIEAERAIEELRARFQADPEKALEARALFIVGESGCGKSTLLRSYEEKIRSIPGAFRETADGDIRPIVSLEVPMGAGKRQFVASILHSLGYKAQESWDSSAIVDEIAHLCRSMQVECFLIDEAHHLVLGSPKKISETQEFLKSLLNRCCSQFVLAGIPSVLQLQEGTKQIDRRLASTVYLDPYDWHDADDQMEFRLLLEDFGRASGLTFDPPLADATMAARMYLATEGRIALISKFLSRVLQDAENGGPTTVSLETLGAIWRSYRRRAPKVRTVRKFDTTPTFRRVATDTSNPFLCDVEEFGRLWMTMSMDAAGPSLGDDVRDAGGWPG